MAADTPAAAGPAAPSTVEELLAAYAETLRASIDIGRELRPADWDRPTDCPGWSVRDQFSHLVGLERYLLGDPRPVHRMPDLPHVVSEFDRFTELDVDVRRGRPGPEVLAELAETVSRRFTELGAAGLTLQTELPSPFGVRPASLVLPLRTFDCWVHEQDIRAAVGRPGGWSEAAAALSVAWIRRALPRTLAQAGALPAGAAVGLVVTGQHGFATTLSTDESGRARDLGAEPHAGTTRVTLTLDSEAFTRRGCGRWSVAQTPVQVDGDAALGAAVLEALPITP